MTDHELLRRAAMAAGHEVSRIADDRRALLLFGVIAPWNSLDDDGDALRLAIAVPAIEVSAILEGARVAHPADETQRGAFVRRAITSAAAEAWLAHYKAKLESGQRVEAVKEYRMATGASLPEAQRALGIK
ncbi:hypothetical protein [Ralstonia pseudosolanacearum]|uniref:hypothetical protein n=1 Tax=Ralstonia pseudosolanacearum TaxID=1310165 RepID=UPI003CF4BD7B